MMLATILRDALQYAGYALEFALLVGLLRAGRFRRWAGLFAYVCAYLLLEGTRSYFFFQYGGVSREYAYAYWLTDVPETLTTFLLVGWLFRRAFSRDQRVWSYLKPALAFTLLLLAVVSWLSISQHRDDAFKVFWAFIVGFQQNLYFACAVLTAALYIWMQRIDVDDDLSLLVSGVGIGYAGPAAALALAFVTHHAHDTSSLFTYFSPLCANIMLLVWFYAVKNPAPQGANAGAPKTQSGRRVPVFAELAAGLSHH